MSARILHLHRLCLRSTVAWLLILAGPGSIGSTGDAPITAGKTDAPVYVILGDPNDLEAIRNRIDHPDFVILTGSIYDALKAQAKPPATLSPLRSVIESVVISGEVLEEHADLTFEFRIALTGAEPAWVPIRLDGQMPTLAREGDRELAIRVVDGSWQVKVHGEGAHVVRLSVMSRVLAAIGSPEGRRLEWSIPEAATTRVQLVLGTNLSDVTVAGNGVGREPMALEPIEGGQRNRVSASLTPRKRLELTWQAANEGGLAAGPALLTAQGEIGLDVERGSIRARSSWDVRSERGTVRRLELRIDPSDELVGLECDGRPVLSDGPADPVSGMIGVTLSEPLRRGGTTRLIVTTRRVFSPDTTSRMTYRGVPLLGVGSQTGGIAIAQRGGDPWVSATPGRGLRQIDPRSDLPANLRARPSIVLAYQFVEQPFELGIQVDPSPPWVQVKSRTTVALDEGRARVDTWLDYTVPRGRVFEAKVALPEEMTLNSIGPASSVATSESLGEASVPSRGKILVTRLTPRASEDGFFSIHLTGWQAISGSGLTRVGLPRPLDAQSRGGLIAVLASRSMTVELNEDQAAPPSAFAPSGVEPPPTWPWPSDRAVGSAPPALWLRHDESPSSLPLKTATRARVIQESTTVDVQLERRRWVVRQETAIRVRFGTVSTLDVAVPVDAEGAWEIEGADLIPRELLGPLPDGSLRYRLTFGREVTDTASLRFRISKVLANPVESSKPTRLSIPRIRILGAESDAPRLRIAADDRIDLEPQGPGWSVVSDDPSSSPRDAVTPFRLERVGTGEAVVLAKAHAIAELPKLVAPRLLIRTTMDASAGLRTLATYRVESHDGAMIVSLPNGAVWERARVGAETVTDVETVAGSPQAYRIKLPSESPGPLVVSLEYVQRGTPFGTWEVPILREGGVVQECYWSVRIPWNDAMLGCPSGWSDANQWVWSDYAFIRQPALSASALASWVPSTIESAGTSANVDRRAMHEYLFSRVGDPIGLEPKIVSRAGLVGSCSGLVLGVGLVLLMARRWMRAAWATLPIAALVAAVCVSPSVLGVVLQSSLVGVGLLSLAALTQRFVERRVPISPSFGEPIPASLANSGASGRIPFAPLVGSEDSTVIRGKAGTTIDHIPAGVSLDEGQDAS